MPVEGVLRTLAPQLLGTLVRRYRDFARCEDAVQEASVSGAEGGTSFTYVTDGMGSAVEQARAAANGKNVAVAGGGTLVRQALKAGLLDALEPH